jgi:hypothetical protein
MRALLGLLAVSLTGCSSTSFVSTWKVPLEGPIQFDGKRVAAVVVTANESTRRAGEDALARRISAGRAHGIPSYTLVSGETPKDQEAAKKVLKEADIEGAVVMRVISSETEVSYSPGGVYAAPYYGSFWGYWGYGWGMAYDPGYLRTDTVVMVETLVYSVTQDKLLWAGRSRTTNPSNVSRFILELSNKAASEMKKAGFIVD